MAADKNAVKIITARQLMNNPCRTICLRRDWKTFAPFLIRAPNLTNLDIERPFWIHSNCEKKRSQRHIQLFRSSMSDNICIFPCLWLPLNSRTQELGRKIECSTDLNSFGRIAAIFEMTIFVADERCVAFISLSNLCCPALNIFWGVEAPSTILSSTWRFLRAQRSKSVEIRTQGCWVRSAKSTSELCQHTSSSHYVMVGIFES